MKKLWLLSLVFVLIVAPGCKKKNSEKKKPQTVRIERDKPSKRGRKLKSLFLDDDVKEFTFEEEAGTDAFSAGFLQDASAVKLVDSDNDNEKSASERHAEQFKYNFKTLYFGFDRYSVNPNQADALEHNLESVRKVIKDGKTVVVEGHACQSAGSSVYNMLLSEKRAQAVAKYLVEHDVPLEQLKIVGRGNEMCIVPIGTREQQAPNRRVELYVL